MCSLRERYFKYRDTENLKGWKKETSGIAIPISNKAFKARSITRKKEHFVMLKESICHEGITALNLFCH